MKWRKRITELRLKSSENHQILTKITVIVGSQTFDGPIFTPEVSNEA